MKQKKFRSYDQQQLKHLADLVCEDVEGLLNTLGIESYRVLDRMISMSCPIHGGDNPAAFNLYHRGESYRGNWKCRTHNCEETFKSSIIGFIRGVLSHEKGWNEPGDPSVSFDDAVQFAMNFCKYDASSLKISKKTREKNLFVNTVKHITTAQLSGTKPILVPRIVVQKNLNIPSRYFLDRGFSKEILIKYDVGDCDQIGKEMTGRAVVPIYSYDFEGMIGCTGRSIWNKCAKCASYHEGDCPDDAVKWLYSKWRHSKNFKTQEHLYNYWYAKKYIEESRTVILVESPGNVWRLEESDIHNSVAVFGASLSDKQKMILDSSGAMNIITIMDNDKAGQEAARQIAQKCGRTYNIKNIVLSTNDIAEMTIEQVKEIIYPQIKEYHL